MDIEVVMVQTKPKATFARSMENRKFSTIDTFINIHISMFSLQAIVSAYETRPIASKMFMECLPRIILTFFAAFCKQIYQISKNKGITELLELYGQNKLYINSVVMCYGGMLGFTLLLTYLVYSHYLDNPLKSGRFFFILVCMNIYIWCMNELCHEEEEKRKRLTIVSTTMTGSMFANCVFGIAYFHSSDLSFAGAISATIFLVVLIGAYLFYYLTEQQDQLSGTLDE